MKARSLRLMLLTGLLACQEPDVVLQQPLPPESKPTVQPSALALPTESPEPVTPALPSSAPGSPVTDGGATAVYPAPAAKPYPPARPWKAPPVQLQELSIYDITPQELLEASLSVNALAVEPQVARPRIFVNGSALWVFREDTPAVRLSDTSLPISDQTSRLQYHADSLYVHSFYHDNCILCLRRFRLNQLSQPEIVRGNVLQFRLLETGELHFYRNTVPEAWAAMRLEKRLRLGDVQMFDVGVIQPDGQESTYLTTRILGPEKTLSAGLDGLYFGIYRISARGGSSRLPMTRSHFSSSFYDENSPGAPIYSLRQDAPAVDIAENIDGEYQTTGSLPLIQDGGPEQVTFWAPSGLELDQRKNLYFKDHAAQETFIRRISPEGQTHTLISANGPTEAGYPAFELSLKSVVPKKYLHQQEFIQDFLIDIPRNCLYILGLYHLYRLDLHNHQLEWLARRQELPGSSQMAIDASGQLYFTNGRRIFRVSPPQREAAQP